MILVIILINWVDWLHNFHQFAFLNMSDSVGGVIVTLSTQVKMLPPMSAKPPLGISPERLKSTEENSGGGRLCEIGLDETYFNPSCPKIVFFLPLLTLISI